MRQGPFIDLFSEVFGIEHKSVRVMTRALRDAGLLTTGARGVNAPHMTFQDAANLTVALLSGQPPGRINEVAPKYLGAKLWDVEITEHSDTVFSEFQLTEGTTAGEFIAALFELYSQETAQDRFKPFLSILGELPPVTIEISESAQSLSVNLQVTHSALLDAHYLFYDFASHEEFARQFPEPKTFDERVKINTLYHEHNEKNKKGMRISRWITRDEIVTIGRAVARGGDDG